MPDSKTPDDDVKQTPSRSKLIYTSAELFRGRREIFIRREAETYRLKITSNDRLVMTK